MMCTAPDCDRPVHIRGYCTMHYQRVRKHGTTELPPRPTLAERLAARIVITESGCWEWQGAKNDRGYGQIGVGRVKRFYTHRVSYELHVGPIPDGLQLDHLCRNTICCNPEHLEPVTARENMRRGRSPHMLLGLANRCAKGHDLREVGYVRPDGQGRICKTCRAERLSEAGEQFRLAAKVLGIGVKEYGWRHDAPL
jgi:hypothetical protein